METMLVLRVATAVLEGCMGLEGVKSVSLINQELLEVEGEEVAAVAALEEEMVGQLEDTEVGIKEVLLALGVLVGDMAITPMVNLAVKKVELGI